MTSFTHNIITIGDYHYHQNPVTKDLTPITLPTSQSEAQPEPKTHQEDGENRYTLAREGNTLLIIDTATGELVRKLFSPSRDCNTTYAQLEDSAARDLVQGNGTEKARRAKRKVSNPHGNELMTYKLNDQERFFVLLKAAVRADKTLHTSSGTLNFNFRDLGRILCMREFTSDHLFSSGRGNEYTMAAYRKIVEKFTTVCRKAWQGRSLAPSFDCNVDELDP